MTRRDVDVETLLVLLAFAGIALVLLSGIVDWSTVDTETILLALQEAMR